MNFKVQEKLFKGYFPGGTVVKTLPSNAGDMGSIPGWGTKLACPKSLHATMKSPCASMKTHQSQNKEEKVNRERQRNFFNCVIWVNGSRQIMGRDRK